MTTIEIYAKMADAQRKKRSEKLAELDADLDSVLARIQDMAALDYPNNDHWLQLMMHMRLSVAYFKFWLMPK